MASIFKKKSRPNWVIQYFDADGKRREQSSGTTILRAAERIANQIEAEVALVREGVVDPRAAEIAAQGRIPIQQHLDDYLESCELEGQVEGHLRRKRERMERTITEASLCRLSDLTPTNMETFLKRRKAEGRGARTRNGHLNDWKAFCRWCVDQNRLASNPLKALKPVNEQADRRKVRRPLTDDEARRLLEVAEKNGRTAWYLGALLAGLRRGDLENLRWGAVDLDRGVIKVLMGKAKGRPDEVPIHPDLADAFREIRPTSALPSAAVFPNPVSNDVRRGDYRSAGIALQDDEGKWVDLHSARSWLATSLARGGVVPQVAQRLLRHSHVNVTMQHYTKLELLDDAAALEHLPSLTPKDDQVAAATGTTGPADRQHQRQQSARAGVRLGASRRETDCAAEETPTASEHALDTREDAGSRKEAHATSTTNPPADRSPEARPAA